MLYGSENQPVKEEIVIRLVRNDARMVKWMSNVRSEYKSSAEELD